MSVGHTFIAVFIHLWLFINFVLIAHVISESNDWKKKKFILVTIVIEHFLLFCLIHFCTSDVISTQ